MLHLFTVDGIIVCRWWCLEVLSFLVLATWDRWIEKLSFNDVIIIIICGIYNTMYQLDVLGLFWNICWFWKVLKRNFLGFLVWKKYVLEYLLKCLADMSYFFQKWVPKLAKMSEKIVFERFERLRSFFCTFLNVFLNVLMTFFNSKYNIWRTKIGGFPKRINK